MTSAAVSLLGFAALLVAGLALEMTARRRPAGTVATAGESLSAAMRTTPGRTAVLAAWIWLGVHFLAR